MALGPESVTITSFTKPPGVSFFFSKLLTPIRSSRALIMGTKLSRKSWMIEPITKHTSQVPACLRFDSRAQFSAADFLSRHVCQNAARRAVEFFFPGDLFKREQK